MRRLARTLFALALVAGAASAGSTARAFVTPRWDASKAVRRSSLIGEFRVLGSSKTGGSTLVDVDIFVTIDATTLRVRSSAEPDPIVLRYRVLEQDDESLTLAVTQSSGEEKQVDVLLGPEQLTMYVQAGDDDDEEVIRLERVR